MPRLAFWGGTSGKDTFKLLERMLLSFWLEGYATISSETSVAILPPGEKQALGQTDTMEEQQREGKKLDC